MYNKIPFNDFCSEKLTVQYWILRTNIHIIVIVDKKNFISDICRVYTPLLTIPECTKLEFHGPDICMTNLQDVIILDWVTKACQFVDKIFLMYENADPNSVSINKLKSGIKSRPCGGNKKTLNNFDIMTTLIYWQLIPSNHLMHLDIFSAYL